MKGYSELKPIFSCRLYDAAVKAEIPMIEIAARVGINRRTIWRYINPCFPDLPRADVLMRIASVLGVSVNYLIGIE